MKVGGNTPFSDYLAKHGRGQITPMTPAKEKYVSEPAQKYKEELKRKAKEDEMRFGPGKVVVEGATASGAAEASNGTSTPTNGGAGDDDDFFDTWDKPTNIIAPKPSSSTTSLPRIGLSPAITPNPSRPATPSAGASISPTASPAQPSPVSPPPAPIAAPVASRAVSSSSIRTTGTGVGGAARAGGAMKLGAGKSKLGGVKKGGAPINFEEAERKAIAEEERIKQLGYDREQEEKAAAAAAAAAASAAAASRSATPSGSSRGEMVGNKQSGGEVDRLGMGFGRLGFGQVSGLSGEEAAKAAAAAKRAAQRANNPEPGEARGILRRGSRADIAP